MPVVRSARTALLLACLICAVAACQVAPSQAITSTALAETAQVEPALLAATATPALYTNPVLDRDFPDPDVLKVGDTYYAFATNGSGTNIPIARSTDLVTWQVVSDALPRQPSWAVQSFGWVWAPEVFEAEAGEYVMYYVARFAMGYDGVQCIGVGTAENPAGPFTSSAPDPFICQTGEGGSIDPSTFTDEDGRKYLLWKNDGNCCGMQTWLYIQELSSDGLSLLGEPTRLITADQVWEGILVEAPTLWKRDGKYYLFYSANAYNNERYAVGYAVADHVLGPYTKHTQPLLKTNLAAGVVGPGGQDVVTGPGGQTYLLFHGWAPDGYRRLYLAPLTWQDGQPEVYLDGKNPLPMP